MGATCPVTVVPNGVDTEKFKAKSEKRKSEFRKELGISENDTVLVTTSRLVKKNAVEDVIVAMKFLSSNVKFLIVGSGRLEESLKSKTKSEKLEERVRFVGFVSHDELPNYLHASDIFIRTPISEGMGNSFIEAMCAGLPVIATPVGGIVDFLKDGETGLFCEVGNPKSIAQKVLKLMKDAESRKYIVGNALHLVQEKYDWNFVAGRMKQEVFEKVLQVS